MTRTTSTPPRSSSLRVPPLENGDHLTRDEFERRYNAMPDGVRAELIEGIVYMAPPALRWDSHGGPHADFMGWLAVYRAATPGVRAGDSASIRLDLDNMPQPDAVMIIQHSCGGQAKLSADDYLEGAPELVAEIAASTVSIDLNEKLRVYRRNGVREYVVWRVDDQAIDWFILHGGQYVPLQPETDGLLHSTIFPGLWLDVVAMTQGRLSLVLEALQKGLATPEHSTFVAELGSRRIR